MQEMASEEDGLRAEMAELAQRLEGVDTEAAQLDAAAGVLEKLGARLREPLSWELRRELIESLVEQVRVDTPAKERKPRSLHHGDLPIVNAFDEGAAGERAGGCIKICVNVLRIK
jgi:hypothetical protein